MRVRDNNSSSRIIGILDKIISIILISLLIPVIIVVHLWDLVWGDGP